MVISRHVRLVDSSPTAFPKVHGRDGVGWPSEGTGLTPEPLPRGAVLLGNVMAGRTLPAAVARVDDQHQDAALLVVVVALACLIVAGTIYREVYPASSTGELVAPAAV